MKHRTDIAWNDARRRLWPYTRTSAPISIERRQIAQDLYGFERKEEYDRKVKMRIRRVVPLTMADHFAPPWTAYGKLYIEFINDFIAETEALINAGIVDAA